MLDSVPLALSEFTMHSTILTRSFLVLALFSGFCQSGNASVVYQSSSFVSATSHGSTLTDSNGPAPVSNAEAFNGLAGANASASAYGNASNFGVAASGGAYNSSRTFSALATSSNTWTLTNDTGVASTFTSSWLVNQGNLMTRLGVGTDWSKAVFGFTLWDSGSILASSRIQLDSKGNIVASGMPFLNQTYTHYSEEEHWVSWDAFTFSINLGVLQPGESKTLTYDLFASADADYSHTPDNYCPTSDMDCRAPRSGAWGSDPGSFTGSPVATFGTSDASQIPEPSSLLLLGLCLPLLAQRRLFKS